MPQVSQPLYCHNNPSLPGVGIRCRAEQYQQCSHKCEEDSVHVAPGEIEIHLPESFFIQEECHKEAHHETIKPNVAEISPKDRRASESIETIVSTAERKGELRNDGLNRFGMDDGARF